MAGVAQVWLTHAELDAILASAFSTKHRVSDRLADGLRDKLLEAYAGVACDAALALHREEDA